MGLSLRVSDFFSKLRESRLRKRRTKRLLSSIERHPDGREHYPNYLKYGKKFMKSFESIHLRGKRNYCVDLSHSSWEAPLSVAVYSSPRQEKPMGSLGGRDFEIKIGFQKDTVHIKAVQGVKGRIKQIKQLEGMLGMPVPNYLLTIIEEHAKRMGYSRVIIDRPEILEYFNNPSIATAHHLEYRKQKNAVQHRMIRMYYSLASSRGYKIVGETFEKRL